MLIQFNPTEKLSAILRNNTSAADSFAGLPNAMPKPSAVGGGPLNVPQDAFEHDVKWFKAGQTNHSNVGYSSDDPAHIARQVSRYQIGGRRGADWLWNGPGGQQDKSCLAAVQAFEFSGLQFDIMLSSTIPSISVAGQTVAQRTAALNQVLDYLRSHFFKSPAYHRIAGPTSSRPVVYCFGLGNNAFDWNAVRAHAHTFGADEPLFAFRFEVGYSQHFGADMYFAWTHCDETWITAAKAMGKPLILSANPGFDNSVAIALPSGWGTPSKTDQRGGQRWLDQLAVARNHPECKTLLIVTGTDYDEGSAIEPGIATGFALTLGITNNVLEWTPPPAPFDHVTVYLSQDGENLMPLAQTPVAGGVTSLDLAELEVPDGTWTFVAVAFGKNSIQHVAGSLTETLGWRP